MLDQKKTVNTNEFHWNALDRKIDSMIQDQPQYAEIKVSIDALVAVSHRAGAIKFLKYAINLQKAGK